MRRRSYGSNQDPASNGGTPPAGPAVGNGTAPPAEEHQLYQNYNQVSRRRSAETAPRGGAAGLPNLQPGEAPQVCRNCNQVRRRRPDENAAR